MYFSEVSYLVFTELLAIRLSLDRLMSGLTLFFWLVNVVRCSRSGAVVTTGVSGIACVLHLGGLSVASLSAS